MGTPTGPLANDAPAKPKSLVSKLSEVMQAVERVAKRGRNEFHKYDYVTEADLADAIRGELASRQLFIFPTVKKYERIPIEVETMKWDDKLKMKVPAARKTQLAEIEVEWTFVDGETGEERTIMVPGVGEDNVDKGFYKAFTGSEKYMLMKSFLIPTGDDPEKDSREEASDARKAGSAAAQEVAQAKIAAHKAKKSADVLFYVAPESQNGHFVEFINIRDYIGGHHDQEDSLRMVFSAHKAKKTKDETALVPSGEVQALLEKLTGDMGVTVKKLEANA